MNYLLINSADVNCHLTLVIDERQIDYSWLAERNLARDLLSNITNFLAQNQLQLTDLNGLGVFKGPGSFTGLRISLTVANTLADSLEIPIVSATSASWQTEILQKLRAHQNEQIVLPLYNAPPKITQPKK